MGEVVRLVGLGAIDASRRLLSHVPEALDSYLLSVMPIADSAGFERDAGPGREPESVCES